MRTIPCPIWSRVMDVIGPIARGVRRRRCAPSENSTPTRRSWWRRSSGSSGFVWGLRGLRDARRDPRGGQPADTGRDDHRGGCADDIDDATSDEDSGQQCHGATDRGEGVRDEEVLVRDEPWDDGGRGRQEEPIHRHDQERAREEGDRLIDRIEEHEPYERGLHPRGEQQDPPAPPPVDEDTDERPEDRVGEGDDKRCLEEPGRGVLLLRGQEHDRGHQRGLEEPVRGLADEPDREQLAEVGARESPADPFSRARPGRHRAVRL